MLLLLAAAAAALVLQTPHDSANAYLDPGAQGLVARARARRLLVDRSIRAYEATVRERIAVGLRALRRGRMGYRREVAGDIPLRRHHGGAAPLVGPRAGLPLGPRGGPIPAEPARAA